MAIGVGAVMGFSLINNFQRPYLSVSVTDFWRRWHISLSTWLKDYVYIPLGGNRCSKTRCYLNILVTFLVSGVWHGANWTFVLWGVLHGMFQIVEKALGLQRHDKRGAMRVVRIAITFTLVTFAWIFFRMPTIKDGLHVTAKILTDMPSALYMGTKTDLVLTVAALSAVVVKDWTEEFTSFSLFHNRHIAVRWTAYLVVLFAILLFGVLDSSSFIYASF